MCFTLSRTSALDAIEGPGGRGRLGSRALPGPDFKGTIDVVRGRLSDSRAAQIVDFWALRRPLSPEAAARRLAEVVCIALDEDSAIAGVGSVGAEDLDALDGRSYWMFRSVLGPAPVAGAEEAMARAAYEVLAAEFDPDAGGPVGLCVRTADAVAWSDSPLAQVGELPDGRRLLVARFAG